MFEILFKLIYLLREASSRVATREEFLIDIAILAPEQILQVKSGSKQLKLKPADWRHYVGERARRGLKLPRAFQQLDALLASD